MVLNCALVSALQLTGAPACFAQPDPNWLSHDRKRPLPPVVNPATASTQEQAGKAPSDATVLFDGQDIAQWCSMDGSPTKWIVRDGYMEVAPKGGEIRTKAQFGDCQLHVEWAAPAKVEGDSQGRGNSGVFLPGGLEIQVLDSFNNPTYADGGAGAYYGINPPLAHALHPPGEFQVYDIVFRKPVYQDGKAVDPGYVTVFMNGVLVQDHTPLEGSGGHMGRTKPGPFPEKGPIRLQDHGNPTRFRNIWLRELPPRPSQGGTDGYLSVEATQVKRKEIAASIRADAAQLKDAANPQSQMLRLMESLIYEKDDATLRQVEQMNTGYVAALKQLPADKLQAKRGEVTQLRDIFRYLTRWNILPATYGPKVAVDQLFTDQGWDRGKKKQ